VPGAPLFRIADLSTVWVNAEVPEAQASLVRPGSRVAAKVPAYPEATFEGRVGAILPEVAAATRTLRARIELANPGVRLKPGMFATLVFEELKRDKSVVVPSEAVIRTGTRDVVIVSLGEGKFRAQDVEVGAEAGGKSEVRKGLQAGDEVVLSGQFLIDSEASLSSTVSRLDGGEKVNAKTNAVKGTGKVLSANADEGYVELDHDPIPALKWPSMKMGFQVADKHALHGLKEGDRVEFEVDPKPNSEGEFQITKIKRAGR
jgi:Cu(I)/Ag(I) efflux system membrane fusion protein